MTRFGKWVSTLANDWEAEFAMQVRALHLPTPVREYRFHATRRWRFDFAWPSLGIAVEIHGGIHSGGRHTRGTGFEKDREKMNAAQLDGWRVFEFTPQMIRDGSAMLIIEGVLKHE